MPDFTNSARLTPASRAAMGRALLADAVRRGVKDLVGRDGPMNAALTASGVRLGDVFRVLAVASDVVDSYGHRPRPAEVPLVALALARYGVKFNLSSLPSRRVFALVARGGRGGSPGKVARTTTRRSVAASGAVVVLRVMRPRAVGTRASGGVGRTGPASDVVVGRRPPQKAERPQPKAERPQPTVERASQKYNYNSPTQK